MVVILSCLALFTLTASGASIRQATLSKVKGEVTVRMKGGEWKDAVKGMVLNEKDEIKTAPGGFAELALDERGKTGKVELKENSHLRINTLSLDSKTGDKVTLLDLAIGKVLIRAQKLKGNSKFEVKTPTSTSGVRGTVFEVNVEEE